MTPRILGAVVVALALLSGPFAATTQAATGDAVHRVADRDCGDFATQAAAQRFYVDQGGPRSDPHRLDEDGDGVACESNPCPCSTGTGGGDGGDSGSVRDPRRTERAKVVDVVDGDTVDVRLRSSGRKVRVRLVGIDTPEVYGGRECWGRQASAATKGMLPVGTRVVMVSDARQPNKDRYGRLLRYVTKVANHLDVGRWLVHHGHATVFVVGDGFTKVRRYRSEQASARRADRGYWGACR